MGKLIAALAVALLCAACGGTQSGGAPAELRLLCEPSTASVYVDERYVSSARRLAHQPARLRPGRHFLTVTAPGYFPHDVELALPKGVTTVRLSLRAIPP